MFNPAPFRYNELILKENGVTAMKKEALFIGGTGTISMAITELIAKRSDEWHLTVLNRGTRKAELPAGVSEIPVDINDEAAAREALAGKKFDTV